MRNRRGTNVVEFALTLPVFVGLLFAVIDFGWYFASKATVDFAVNHGCREGSMIDSMFGDPVITARQKMNEAVQIMPVCANGCSFNVQALGEVPAKSLICSVETSYTPFVGLWSTPDTLSSKTIMRLEWQR